MSKSFWTSTKWQHARTVRSDEIKKNVELEFVGRSSARARPTLAEIIWPAWPKPDCNINSCPLKCKELHEPTLYDQPAWSLVETQKRCRGHQVSMKRSRSIAKYHCKNVTEFTDCDLGGAKGNIMLDDVIQIQISPRKLLQSVALIDLPCQY